jgi:cation diffusion facilitator family transporter
MAIFKAFFSTADTPHKRAIQVTRIGFMLGVMLALGKFAAGHWGNSYALVADGLHSVSDVVTDIILIFGLYMASRPVDHDHNFGHGKFETVAASLIGVALIVAGASLIYNSYFVFQAEWQGGTTTRPTALAVVAALLSFGVKEFLFVYTLRAGKALGSNSLKANAWHHHSDALSSLGAFIGVGLAWYLGDELGFFDPLAAIVVSFFVLKVGWDVLRDSFNELMEKSLGPDVHRQITTVADGIAGLSNPHSIKTRKIGQDIAIEMHIDVDVNTTVGNAHALTEILEDHLKEAFGESTFISIHVEPKI